MKDAGIFQRQKLELLTPGPAGVATTPLSSLPIPASSHIHPNAYNQPPMTMRNLTQNIPALSTPLPKTPLQPQPRSQTQSDHSSGLGVEEPVFQRASSNGILSLDEHVGLGGHAHASIIIHKLDSFPPLSECVWDTAGALHSSPDPSMIVSQFAIYSINNFMLLTVSKDFIVLPSSTEDGSGDSSGVQYETFFEKEKQERGETPDGHPWEELKQRIRSAEADVRVNSSSAKYLSFCAMVR